MKKLRVKVRFRDERNFFVIHQEGDMIVVNDPGRATRLVEARLCEVVNEGNKADESDSPELEPETAQEQQKATATEKPKKATRKKKEA